MCDFGDKMITSEEKTNISREGACETSRSSKIVVFYICVIYTNLSVWKVGKNSKYPILITCIDLCQTEQGELILDQWDQGSPLQEDKCRLAASPEWWDFE